MPIQKYYIYEKCPYRLQISWAFFILHTASNFAYYSIILVLFIQLFLILRRGNTISLLEVLGEVARIIESHLVCHLTDG